VYHDTRHDAEHDADAVDEVDENEEDGLLEGIRKKVSASYNLKIKY
jgi:hypothetical protein